MTASERAMPVGQPFLFHFEHDEEIRQAVLRMVDSEKAADQEQQPEGGERIEVTGVRLVQPKDLYRILQWFSDPETQGHLDPLPRLPADWSDENQVMEAVLDLGKYYDNQGEPEKITALAAVTDKDKALGVATVRWRGDPWLPKGHKIASIERLIVNPKVRGKGVGSRLVEESLDMIFGKERDYPEVRAWVMSDDRAGHWERNFHFFRNLGFGVMAGDHTWREYAQKRGLGENTENRDAVWFQLKREKWEKMKLEQPSKISFTSGK